LKLSTRRSAHGVLDRRRRPVHATSTAPPSRLHREGHSIDGLNFGTSD
jgi:hypothetical protein